MSATRLRIGEPSRLLRRRKIFDAEGVQVGLVDGPWHDSLRLIAFIVAVFAAHSLGKIKLILPILLLLGIYLWLRPRGMSLRLGKTPRWAIRTGWWIRDGSRWWIHGPRGQKWLWTPGRRIIERSLQTTHKLVSVDDQQWLLKAQGSPSEDISLQVSPQGGFEISWQHGENIKQLAFVTATLAKIR